MPLRFGFPRISFFSRKSTTSTTANRASLFTWRDSPRVFFTSLLYFTAIPLYITRNHYSFYSATGPSMSPLLSPPDSPYPDIFLIRKNIRLSTDPISEGGDGIKGELKRGMVITFWKPTVREPRLCVKRIVALEGDVVTPLKRDRLYDKEGRSTDVDVWHTVPEDKVTVPFGHVWVEGVNEDNSIDSTEFGAISKSLITGIATNIYWPKARRGEIAWEEDWNRSCKKRVRIARDEYEVPKEWEL